MWSELSERALALTRRPITRRAGWGLVDQALSSATNLAIAVLVARSADTRGFGMYSLAFAVYLVLGGIARAVFGHPFVIRFTGVEEGEREAREAVLGGGLAMGVASGAVIAAIVPLLPPDASMTFLALAVVLPGLLVQGVCRSVFFARGAPRSAAANDGIWALAQVFFFAITLAQVDAAAPELIIAWGAAATIAAVAGSIQLRVVPRMGLVRSWWRAHRDIAWPFVGDFTANQTTQQLYSFALPAVADVLTLGVYRAGLLLYGPINFLGLGLFVIAQPEGVRARRRSLRTLTRALAALSILLAIGTVMLGVALTLLPDAYGREILGATWERAKPLILPLAAFRVGYAVSETIAIGLRVLEAGRRLLWTRIAVAVPALVFLLGGAVLGGAVGASFGSAIAGVLSIPVWVWQYRQAVRKASHADAVEAAP